jgi:putative ABC transport system substrate-binding protein
MAMRRRAFIATLGGAAAWPLMARAQQPAMPVIGYMSARSPEDTVEVLKAFHNGLEQGGFIDSPNVNIEYRWARGDYSRLPVLATELIGRHINVLVATGGDASARAAKEATATIPVVFNMGGDPVKAGLVKSFNRPGGNVTGSVVLTETLEPKRLELLLIVPGVALLVPSLIRPIRRTGQLRDEAAVPKFGRRLLVAS